MKTFSYMNKIIFIFLGVLAICTIFPFIIVLINATRSHAEIITQPVSLIPGNQLINNYKQVIQYIPIWRGIFNTILFATVSMVLTVYFSTCAAYGFTVYEFRGKKIFLGVILVLILIPSTLGMVGLFDVIAKLGLLDTYWSLFLPAIGNVGVIFFMLQFMKSSISISLIEQGRIDGVSEIQIFHHIIMPILLPGMATMGIFSFVGSWNNLLGPLLFLFDPDKFPLTVLISQLPRDFASDYGMIYFSLAFSILPLILVFLFLSRFIVEGLMAGGIKE